FSSRRRHTRFSRDWSSDVCSSDLTLAYLAGIAVVVVWWLIFGTGWGLKVRAVGEHPEAADTVGINVLAMRWQAVLLGGVFAGLRSEERRVGKECIGWW